MSAVSIDRRSVWRARTKVDFTEIWLLVRASGSARTDITAVEQAASIANDAADARGHGDDVFAAEAVSVPKGVALRVPRCAVDEALDLWLEDFAAALDQLGVSGRVTTAVPAWAPDWPMLEHRSMTELTAFVSYSCDPAFHVTDPNEPRGWHVPAAATAEITGRSARWTIRGEGDTFVTLGTFSLQLDGQSDDPASRAAALLAASLPEQHFGAIGTVNRPSRRVRSSWLGALGVSLHQVADPQTHWRDRLRDLIDLLIPSAHLIDVAMIRPAPRMPSNWQAADYGGPPTPAHVSGYEQHARAQHADTVLDAHGLQILTQAHLDKAHDLSDWVVREIAPDRFLVGARRLTPWFERPPASIELVGKARHDFGEMIYR